MPLQDLPDEKSSLSASLHQRTTSHFWFLRFPHKHRRLKRRALVWTVFLPFILLGGILINWVMILPVAFAMPATLASPSGALTYQQYAAESQASQGQTGPYPRPPHSDKELKPTRPSKSSSSLPGIEPATMHDLAYVLDDSFVSNRPTMATLPSQTGAAPDPVQGQPITSGTNAFTFTGDDGRLEVDVPRGVFEASKAQLASGKAPVGQLLLQLHQMAGHYIESSSILGTYQLQVIDSLGNVVQGMQLKKPVTLVYHYQKAELQALNINADHVVLAWSGALATASVAKTSTTGLVVPMTNDATQQTLSAQTTMLAGPLTLSSSDPALPTPNKPDLYETAGNSGQYSYSYPLKLIPGPGGMTPQLSLSYSSQAPNERFTRRSPSGPEGEGWSLSLGSITASPYSSTSAGGSATWYSINGVDGISDRLVPSATANYYETQHVSHLLIHWTGSCWQVWDKNDIYYELGCTSDSLQYQTDSSGTRTNYEWDVNGMIHGHAPNTADDRIYAYYLQDTVTSNGYTTVRDSALKQIIYGTYTPPSTYNTMGTVDFHYHMPSVPSGQTAFATAYGTNYQCSSAPPSNTTMRCDDPTQFGTIPPPTVMSTMELDSITNYVGADTANQPAYTYSLTYQDNPFTNNYWDPYTFIQQAAAGDHLLTKITSSVYIQGTAHVDPGVVFSYTSLRDSYDDPTVPAGSSSHFSGQTFWQYLTHYQDLKTGTGATISYATGSANMEGTPYVTDGSGNEIDDRFDPFYCNNQANNSDTSKRCGAWLGYESWSKQLVTQIQAIGTDSSGQTSVSTTTYGYSLTAVPQTADPVNCSPITGSGVPPQEAECTSYSWTPSGDGDFLDYYHSEYRGFNAVYIYDPAGNLTANYYYTTEGWWTPASDGLNYNGGQLYHQEVYQGHAPSTSTLLRITDTDYIGVNNYSSKSACLSGLSTVYTPCLVTVMATHHYYYEGSSDWISSDETDDTYDDLNTTSGYVSGGYHNLTQEVLSSSNAPTITKKWTYNPNSQAISGWQYYDVSSVAHSEVDDSSGHVWQCQDNTYDEGAPAGTPTPSWGLATTTTVYSTCGTGSTALKSYTGYDQYGNTVETVDALGVANASWYSTKGCTLATAPIYKTSAWTASRYTSCSTYDTTHTAGLPVSQTNALGQTVTLGYDYTSAAAPTSTIDANGQTSSYGYSYDGSGNETLTITSPGETGAYTTRQFEHSSCTTSSTLPCYEIDSNSLLYSSAVSRTFYDALGRAVETRTPGPTPGDDTVVLTVYNDQQNSVWKSVPFEVTSGQGWIDPTGAVDVNGHAPAGTVTFSDALGRAIATQDPNYGSTQEPGLACSTRLSGTYTACTNYTQGAVLGTTATNHYVLAQGIDANGHVTLVATNTLGQTVYTVTTDGLFSGTVTADTVTATQYNVLGKPTSVVVTDAQTQSGQSITSVTTTMTYDDLGRQLTVTDPDQGTFTNTYDADSHLLSTTQTSGSNTRTLGVNYDLLGRVGCQQTAAPTINNTGACSAGNPLIQNTYDTTVLGTQGSTDFPVGRLTQSIATTYYTGGTSATVTQKVQTDQRGRGITQQMQIGVPSAWSVTTALPTYQVALQYNDANQPTTTTATAGTATYTFTQVYDGTNGVLQGLSNNGTATANLGTLTYNEWAQLASLTYLSGSNQIATEQFGYDSNLRPNSLTATWLPPSGNSGQILGQTQTYDNGSNVTSKGTTFASIPGQSGSGGAETQNFCYDSQNRLLWSGNSGTQPGAGNGTCGSGTLANSLSGAAYTNPYLYTNLGQIWQGPTNGQGSNQQYLYCDSTHPHQLTGIYALGSTCASKGTASYTATYDPWGNETGRTTGGVTATLGYDALNRLVTWDAGTNSKEWYVYDASGNRVLKRTIGTGGTTTLTAYAYGLQQLGYTGTGTLSSQNDYYSLAGHLLAWTNGTSTTYDLTDTQSSVLTTFSASAIVGEQNYGPYGNQRYTKGTIGTDKGYTGQFHDALTGLDYYNARFYDPVMAQFLTPDVKQGNAQGMDPYNYVGGNPETNVDPTGQCFADDNGTCIINGKPTCTLGSCTSPNPPGHSPVDGPSHGSGSTNTSGSGSTNTSSGNGCPGGGHMDAGICNSSGTTPTPTPTPTPCLLDCHNQQATNTMNNGYDDWLTKLSLVLDGLGLLIDIAQIFSFKTLAVMGGFAAVFQAIAALGHAIHFIANIFIAFNHGAIPSWVQAMLIAGDSLSIAGNLLNSIWLGVGWLAAATGSLVAASEGPELVAMAMASAAITAGAQLGVSFVQSIIDGVRIDQYNFNHNMTPKQRIDACTAKYGAALC